MRVSISNARGSALVLVLWVSFGLVSLAIYFGHGMSMELKAASNSEAGVQAEQAIEGAVRYVKYLLANLSSQGRLPEPDLYVTEAAEVGEAFFWITGRDPAAVDMTRPYFELIDESGKLNLNTALYTNLMELPFMTVELADAIIDWRDADDEPRSSGAESDVYLRYNPPMYAKNAPFESI